jgi:hypothetical protein
MLQECILINFLHAENSETNIRTLKTSEPGRSVSIVTGYALDDRGSIPDGTECFSSTLCVQPGLRPTQPPVQWVPGILSETNVAGACC